jgi:hypothetical protein
VKKTRQNNDHAVGISVFLAKPGAARYQVARVFSPVLSAAFGPPQ